ncbi:HesA/MoeB/ThiF family protein [Demequina sp.]|uniref:HesA/MoeB/ThiF family protein n=1 Tax=Demequina sp. TaxID=2050685 RepID=UPI0025C562B4|nr:HesA/MoeB/ThiF family protein [Demequina sp.]
MDNTDPYLRQRVLPGFGDQGQRSLTDARVAIVGQGGLGCPVALYLAAAGVGHLTLIDSDTVADSNLHRQILFAPADVGRAKVDAAAAALGRLAPGVSVAAVQSRLTPENAVEALVGHNVIVDSTDTFASRLTVADAAAALGVPVAWGAVQGWFGQVTVFDGSVGLRDIFPVEPPPDFGVCDAGGVLGTLCGQVGTAMATEAVKLVTGVGVPLVGVLSVIDAREGRWRDLDVRRADATGE